MPQSKLRLLSIFLGVVVYLAIRSGHFLFAAIIMLVQGLLIVIVAVSRWERAQGVLVMTGGTYLLLLVLGILGPAVAELISRQTAVYVGAAFLVAGVVLIRRTERKKLGFIVSALGIALVAYGLGYIG